MVNMQGDKKPLISVLMGVYYRQKDLNLLKRSVESVLTQTFNDFEFLICDGGSSAETISFLDFLANKDYRIRLVRDDSIPFDLAHKLNACLSYANGKYIARMDDDDFSHPERFERQVQYLERHPNIAFTGCNVVLKMAGKQVGIQIFPEYPQVMDFYFTQPFIHPTLLFRKSALVTAKGYSEDKHQVLCEDYDLLLRLYAAGYCGANLQELLFDYTVSPFPRGNRKMRHRWNEAVTRYCRFKELGVLAQAFPYVAKPIVAGLLPEKIIMEWKKLKNQMDWRKGNGGTQ